MNIELDFSSYESEFEQLENHFLKLAQATFSYLKMDFNAYISLSLVSLDSIHSLNKEFRQIDRPTDVISFAFLDGMDNKDELFKSDELVVLGEIYISPTKAIEQAKEYQHSLIREFSFLFVHGLLHLLGYDHIEKEDEKIMFDLQNKILEKEGISR